MGKIIGFLAYVAVAVFLLSILAVVPENWAVAAGAAALGLAFLYTALTPRDPNRPPTPAEILERELKQKRERDRQDIKNSFKGRSKNH